MQESPMNTGSYHLNQNKMRFKSQEELVMKIDDLISAWKNDYQPGKMALIAGFLTTFEDESVLR